MPSDDEATSEPTPRRPITRRCRCPSSPTPAAEAAPPPAPKPAPKKPGLLATLQAGWDAFFSSENAYHRHVTIYLLVACLLSLRTQDATTREAAARLFAVADTPAGVLRLPASRLARLIYPVGFYRTKARNVVATASQLLDRFGGAVPSTIDELVTLPGVGRKTANLVLTEGFRAPAICVDTHVHRILNIWGYVATHTPLLTEWALRAKLPRAQWLDLNRTLVAFGQRTCLPVSPWCSRCPVAEWCPRIGVGRSR